MDSPKPEFKLPLWQESCKYTHLQDLNSFPGVPKEVEYVSLDFETTGLNRASDLIVGASFSFAEGESYYISVRHKETKNTSEKELLEFFQKHFYDKTIVYWNAKFDRAFLKRLGFKEKAWADASIYSYVNDPHICGKILKSSLKAHCKHFFGVDMLSIEEALGIQQKRGRKKDLVKFYEAPVNERILAYVGADADITLRLFYFFKIYVEKDKRLSNAITLDHALIDPIDCIEQNGIRVDLKYAQDLKKKIEAECIDITNKLKEYGGPDFNPDSSRQVAELLFGKLKLPVLEKSEKTGAPSAKAYVLETLHLKYGDQFPALDLIHKYRTNKKILSTYVIPVITGINPQTGCVHPCYKSTATVTGRLSGTGDGHILKKFNGQSIPKSEIRRMFIPHEGHTFVAVDLSNIEVRIIAHYSNDPVLLKMFVNGEDMHDTTTKLAFNVDKTHPEWEAYRKKGKIMNFNLAYAFGPTRLAQMLRIDLDKAQEYFNLYFKKAYPTWGRWKYNMRDQARENPVFYTFFGRRRNLKYDYLLGMGNGDRKAINYLIQGTCADLLRYAMVRCHAFIKKNNLFDKVKMCGTVHDELIFSVAGKPGESEFDSILAKIKEIMEYTPKDFRLPVKADLMVGTSWFKEDLKGWENNACR